MREQLKWYDDKADNSPWLDALAELRQRAARELLPARPGDHRCDRSVRREGARQPRLLSTSLTARLTTRRLGPLRQKACTLARGALPHVVGSVTSFSLGVNVGGRLDAGEAAAGNHDRIAPVHGRPVGEAVSSWSTRSPCSARPEIFGRNSRMPVATTNRS